MAAVAPCAAHALLLCVLQLLDELEPIMTQGGVIVDFHSAELFPERWFDLVLVLRASNTNIFDRLTARCVALRCVCRDADRPAVVVPADL